MDVPKKRIAVVQSNYIPWKGYFDLIHAVDEFVLFDDAQYTRRDWRNRNRIKTPHGPIWLTIPVSTKGRYTEPIREITVSDPGWGPRHWKTIAANYRRAPFFHTYAARFEALYCGCRESRLSAINYTWITAVCDVLGIQTKISWSTDYDLREGRVERILGICRQAGAGLYLSGPTARAYLDEARFAGTGVEVAFFDYSGYRDYPQLFPPFEHRVSVLDLIFNEGPNATRFMLSF